MLSMLAFFIFFCLTVDWFGPLDVLQSMPCNFFFLLSFFTMILRGDPVILRLEGEFVVCLCLCCMSVSSTCVYLGVK